MLRDSFQSRCPPFSGGGEGSGQYRAVGKKQSSVNGTLFIVLKFRKSCMGNLLPMIEQT